MSALCKGEILRHGLIWTCVNCGISGTHWLTAHKRYMTKAEHFLECLVVLASNE